MASEAESQGLEFKREVTNFMDISKAACAFANASSGRIIVGVGNDGKSLGVAEKEIDLLQQRLEGAIQKISPVPFHKIGIEEREGKKVVAVEIYQIGEGSFCTFGGIVYYRSGSTNAKLEGKTLQDYMVKRRMLYFDESVSKAGAADVDLEKLRIFLKKRTPGVEFEEKMALDQFSNLGVLQKNGEPRLKNAGVLFFSKEPAKFIPQNEMKLVRFKGKDAVDIIDSRFVNATIPDNVKEAEDFVRKNTRTAYKIEKVERMEVPEYPQKVIREATVNAIVHRDYFSRDAIQINIFDDRMEFINPGSLQSGLSVQILGSLSIQRNPLVYRLMRDLGLVEGLATGIPRMRSGMKEAGLPEPVFDELGNFFRVTLYNRKPPIAGVHNERQKKALSYLEKNPSISSKTYAKLNSVSHPMAVADLNRLCAMGAIRKVGKTRGAYYVMAKK